MKAEGVCVSCYLATATHYTCEVCEKRLKSYAEVKVGVYHAVCHECFKVGVIAHRIMSAGKEDDPNADES